MDVYTIHYRDGKTPIEDVLGELDKLKEAGKIRFFGLSNIHANGMNELRPYAGRFACCQDELSLACRKNEQDLLAAQDILKTTPMTWGSLGQGILTGKYTKGNIDFGADDRRSRDIYINFHGEKLDRNMQTVEVLRKIATERGKSISACAIRCTGTPDIIETTFNARICRDCRHKKTGSDYFKCGSCRLDAEFG